MESMSGLHTHVHEQPAVPPVGDLAAALHTRGMRVTPQREHILSAVRRLGHATPEQIADAVADADVTTVYRTLELFEELGLVRHTHLGHGAPAYGPAENDHVHVVCHTCSAVIESPPDLVDELAARLLTDRGFVLDRSHFAVFGQCRDCADRAHRAAHAEQRGDAGR
jgi:Fur family ferric uptake transcriptional regulator